MNLKIERTIQVRGLEYDSSNNTVVVTCSFIDRWSMESRDVTFAVEKGIEPRIGKTFQLTIEG